MEISPEGSPGPEGGREGGREGVGSRVDVHGVPFPSVALAREYLALAANYRASHQQVTKHLATYLGPLLRRPGAVQVRARVLGYRGAPGDRAGLAALSEALCGLEKVRHGCDFSEAGYESAKAGEGD